MFIIQNSQLVTLDKVSENIIGAPNFTIGFAAILSY